MSIKKKTIKKKVAKRKTSKKVFKDSRELSQWHLDTIKSYFEEKAIHSFRALAKEDKGLGIDMSTTGFAKMVDNLAEETTNEIAQSIMWRIAKEKILNK